MHLNHFKALKRANCFPFKTFSYTWKFYVSIGKHFSLFGANTFYAWFSCHNISLSLYKWIKTKYCKTSSKQTLYLVNSVFAENIFCLTFSLHIVIFYVDRNTFFVKVGYLYNLNEWSINHFITKLNSMVTRQIHGTSDWLVL